MIHNPHTKGLILKRTSIKLASLLNVFIQRIKGFSCSFRSRPFTVRVDESLKRTAFIAMCGFGNIQRTSCAELLNYDINIHTYTHSDNWVTEGRISALTLVLIIMHNLPESLDH